MSFVIIGKGLVVAAVAATALVAGGHTPHPATDAAGSPADAKVVCHRLLQHAPARLKTDLRAARKLPKGEERRAAVRSIHKNALAGGYGTKVRSFVEHRKQRRAHWLKNAPAQLRQDLRSALKQPAGDQRKAALAKVWQSALGGSYGDQVQRRAQHRMVHHEACRAQRTSRQASASGSSQTS
ncbi:MAG: hypothetical protein ABI873_20245 [Marmoricola sp.]